MLDIELLKIMKYRHKYKKLVGIVPKTAMDEKTNVMIEAFGRYFETFKDEPKVKMTILGPRFIKWFPDIARSKEQLSVYIGIMKQAHLDTSDSIAEGIEKDLHEAKLATTLGSLGQKWDAGDLEDILAETQKAVTTFKLATSVKEDGWIDAPIAELLKDLDNTGGLRWRLDCINKRIRGLQGGDFVIVAARPDAGKTTFVADTVSFIAPQLAADRPVLWLNNEGVGRRIVPRIYQAALGATMHQMSEWNANSTLEEKYIAVVGALDKIRVKDIHGMNTGQVEALIEYHKPGVVVMDMIDNIKGFGDAPRTDLILEQMYQWARQTGVEGGHVTIATSQLSADAEGLQYPTQSMLKDSKTGKQGAADLMITLGKTNDPGSQWLRYIGMPKNKLRLTGAPSSIGDCVFMNADTARYEPLPEELPDE